MTFREDGEGLNDRSDRLDHDLQMASKSLNEARERRLQHLEHELADAQDRLNRMQQSMRILRDDQGPPAAPPATLFSAGPSAPMAAIAKALPVLLPVGMVAMLGFAIGHNSGFRRHSMMQMRRAPLNAHMTGSTSTRGLSETGASEANARIRWNAHVKKASGLDLAPGSACRIEGRFGSRGAHLASADVEVWCNDRLVYEKGTFTGPEAVVSLDEYATDNHAFVYNLDLEDTTRPAFDKRSTASIDTDAHTAIISRDTGNTFRLELDVEPVAAPLAASGALFNVPRAASAAPHARIARTAHVVSATENAPVASGDRCTVEVVPATPRSGWSCRTFIRCGEKAVYGEQRTGYGECSGSDDKIQVRDLGFTMEDGDPKLEADFARGIVTLHEEDTANWNAQFKLD